MEPINFTIHPQEEEDVKRERHKEGHSGWVYFVRVMPDGPIKIGRSNRVSSRVQALQTDSHAEIKPLLVLVDHDQYERRLHRHFQYARIRGEWFRPCDALIDLITSLRAETDKTIALKSEVAPLFDGDLLYWLKPMESTSLAEVDPEGPLVNRDREKFLALAADMVAPMVGCRRESWRQDLKHRA